MMIKTLIIDDEPHVREDLKEKLKSTFPESIQVVGEAESISTGLDAIHKMQPDLILLDIHLKDGVSFDLLSQIPDKKFNIIFVTGYDQHAIKAIKVGALDYILKPVDKEELKIALQKALDRHGNNPQLEKLLEISGEFFKGVEKKRVILKTSETVYAIYEDDIIYCRSDGNYTTFYTQQMEKILVSKSLKQVEEILSEKIFVRCHQSYIVNKKHVLKYNKNGVLIVNLDFKVPVSSRRKEYVLKCIFD